ncbi:MAG TPA: tetratricopeptide repeat protein, partial [Pyrinomonadaceae bacterium]|nr:tetratricopeptide repeat protein [Pyrinomonadaceae bacterium]
MRHKTKLTRAVIILGALSFLYAPGAAQTTDVLQQQIREAREQGKPTVAQESLQALRKSNPQAFEANNYDYLLARLQESAGNLAEAEANYQGTVTRNSVLKEYSLWHLAQISRSTGDLVHERERLRLLLNLGPNSLLRQAAAVRLGQSFLESQDFKSAAAAFRQLSGS